jgi:hypothetical protein
MKVKLSYTVDLDDVPNEVNTILNLKTNLKYDDMMNNVYESLSQKNYLVAIDNIDLVRKKLSAIDMVLNDCQSILSGYTKALVQQESTNEQTDGE